MLAHVRYAAVVDSYFSDFHCIAKTGACVDSQAVAGGSGDDPMGPFKIENNFLEAAGECILLGGGEATATPTDVEIRHNHLFKPTIWMRGEPGFVGGQDGNPFIVKNLFELKNAQRVLFEDNVLENTWGGFTQFGFAILLGPKNQAGKNNSNLCPSCIVLDITVRNVTISHVAGGFQIGNGLSDNKGAAKDGGRYSIHDVVVDDIDGERYKGFGTFAQFATAPGDTPAPRLHDLSIDHITAFPPQSAFIIGGPVAQPHMSGLSITNSIVTAGAKVLGTTGGGPERNCAAQPAHRGMESVLHDCFSTYGFHHNVIIEGGGGWPKDNWAPKNIADVGFADYKNGKGGGDYRLSSSSEFKNAGADHKDVGAHIEAIREALKDVP